MSKKLVRAHVSFMDGMPASQGFEQVALEPHGLVIFDDVMKYGVRFFPWHRIAMVVIGSDPDHPDAPTS